MALKVAFQMDPIERIDIRGDSTFALLLEAQWRGHDVFYYTPDNLSLRDGKLIARGHSLTVEDSPGDHYRLAHVREVDLATFDAVQLRQDPPFDKNQLLGRVTAIFRRGRQVDFAQVDTLRRKLLRSAVRRSGALATALLRWHLLQTRIFRGSPTAVGHRSEQFLECP